MILGDFRGGVQAGKRRRKNIASGVENLCHLRDIPAPILYIFGNE
jgi:hypothetical protein